MAIGWTLLVAHPKKVTPPLLVVACQKLVHYEYNTTCSVGRIPSLAIARSSDRFLWRGALARKRDSIPFVSRSVLIAFTRVHTNSLYYYFASCISVHTACMHMHRASHGFAFNEPTFQHSFISCCMHTHSISLFFFSTRQTLNSLFAIPFWVFFRTVIHI
jgi:hypothetical protein